MCGHVCVKVVRLLPWDCYKLVKFDNACTTYACHCMSITNYVHYKLCPFCTQGKLQPAATQHLGMVKTWLNEGSISLSNTKTANISGKIVYLWMCMCVFAWYDVLWYCFLIKIYSSNQTKWANRKLPGAICIIIT